MNGSTQNETIERQLSWRYATKRFDPSREVSAHDWTTLQHSVLQAPTSFGLQPFRMISIETPGLREQLRSASWNQPQIVEASKLVVFAAKRQVQEHEIDEHLARISQARGVPIADLAPYRGMMLGFIAGRKANGAVEAWCTQQAYLALGFLLSTSALLNIDACPLEGIDPVAYDELLGLGELGLTTKVACALGYRSEEDASAAFNKVRLPAERLIVSR